MLPKDPNKAVFFGVGIFLILAGAAAFAYGIVAWLFNYFGDTTFSVPSEKMMGGLVILGIGYLIVELELLRRR